MNYEQSIEFIHSTYKFGSKLGLKNIRKLCNLLGDPQNSYKIIHIAGTNGKGSTSNLIHDVLMNSGYRTGLFISPYLEEFTERIQINKKQIGKESLSRITSLVKEKIDVMLDEGYSHPTEFEVVTAVGFKYFQEQNIDFLVLEVGLGGKLDSTNVVKDTLVSIITSISYDHMQYLGNTLEEIAYQKAGIIKGNSNVVIYPQDDNIKDVIKKTAKEKNAKIYEANKNDILKIRSSLEGQYFKYLKNDVFNLPELKLQLLGEHQLYNALTALLALEIIKKKGYKITEKNIIDGFENCRFPGRFEVMRLNPTIIIDGGHNINGIEYFSKAVKEYIKNKKIILFYGMLKDKNPEKIIPFLIPLAKKIYTLTPNSPRAMKADELALLISQKTDINVTPIDNYNEMKNILKSMDKEDVAAFVGSLYMIGEVRKIIKSILNNIK